MHNLIEIRTNILYTKDEETRDYKKFFELVLLTAQSGYQMNNQRQVVREHKIKENRIVVSESNLDAVISNLQQLKDVEEKDLK